MDKMREEFEEWATSCHMCTYFDDVEYRHQSTEWAWKSWEASRDALRVEIPTIGEASSFGGWVVFDTDAVKEMLDNAGVSYK